MKDKYINSIVDNIKQGKVSFLVGAGISYNSGVPIVGYIKYIKCSLDEVAEMVAAANTANEDNLF